MIFAAVEYPQAYPEVHHDLVRFLCTKFPNVESGIQGDSWIWIQIGDERVAIDTFSSMKHWIKSSRPGDHVDSVIQALKTRFVVHVLSSPEREAHEPDE